MIMPTATDYPVDPLHKSEAWTETAKSHVQPMPQSQTLFNVPDSKSRGITSTFNRPEDTQKPTNPTPERLDISKIDGTEIEYNLRSSPRHSPEYNTSIFKNKPVSPGDASHRQILENDSVTSSPSSGSLDGVGRKKRTASGTVKVQDTASLQSPTHIGTTNSHSRNASTNSITSSVGELSFQLKTRLNHAMSKVQREQKNRSEILPAPLNESKFTPISTPTFAHRRSYSAQPTGNSGVNADRQSRRPVHATDRRLPAVSQATSTWSPSYSSSNQAGGYEEQLIHQSARTLAPAPEIISSSHRRRANGTHKKPSLVTTTHPSVTSTALNPSQLPGAPSTPTPQEQDAVDTLLFMSGSPAGSAHFPRPINATPTSQTSPRRSQFGTSSSQETFRSPNARPASTARFLAQVSMSSNSDDEAQSENSQREAKRRSTALALATEKDVDRLLDQIAANRNEDDEDLADLIPICSETSPHINGPIVNTDS